MERRAWDDLLSERDRDVFEASGYGQRLGWGRRPAVLVIDVNQNFLGDKREPIAESIKRFPYSCGEAGWDTLPHLKKLLTAARSIEVPIAYCTGRWTPTNHNLGVLSALNKRHHGELASEEHRGHHILSDVAPQPEDIFVEKHYPSMFMGTPLLSYLLYLQVDTLLITGCTTSGCVRATTVDAYSYNFRPMVVEECVFDRSEISHAVSLLDMEMKYGDVVSVDESVAFIQSLKEGVENGNEEGVSPRGDRRSPTADLERR